MSEPVTKCGACLQADDHPKHQVHVGVSQSPSGRMYNELDYDRNGCIYYHFDCPSEWNDLSTKLAVSARPAIDPEKPWEAWEQSSADEHRAVADLQASIVAQARAGVHAEELRQWIVNLNQRGGAGGIDQTAATAYLAALAINSSTSTVGTKTYTGPFHLRLMTANGSDASSGTELSTGSGYTAGGLAISFAGASAGTVSSNGAVSWTNMPACTLTGAEEWDTGGSPQRSFWGPWTAGSIAVAAGNTFTVSSGALTNSLS